MEKSLSPAIRIAIGCLALGWSLAADGESPAGQAPWRAYRVTIENSMTGRLDPSPGPGGAANGKEKPAEELGVSAKGAISFREVPLALPDQKGIAGCFRIYDQMDYERKIGTRTESLSLRPQARRVLLDQTKGELIYSPDAPLRLQELDLYATHTSVEALKGLLPAGNSSRWQASAAAAAELAGLAAIESGTLDCSDQGTVLREGAPHRKVLVEGTVVGPSPDGRSRNLVSAEAEIDSQGHIVSINATGGREILGAANEILGRFDVDYRLTVEPLTDDAELTEATIAALPTIPEERQTDLEWEDMRLGINFRYPRLWELRVSPEGELLLSQGKNSLVVHVEQPQRVPVTNEYLEETKRFLASSKIPFQPLGPPREVVSTAGRLGNFQLQALIENQATILDYWVVERGGHGVTLAGRLVPLDASRMSEDLQRMARWVRFLPPTSSEGK
jgi:hypothetical protein